MNDKTLEELLELIKENETQGETPAFPIEVTKVDKPKKLMRSVERFLQDNNVGPGLVKYPTYVVYYIYCDFCRTHNYTNISNRASRVQFGRLAAKLFDRVRHGKQRFYMLSDFVEMTPELMAKAKDHLTRTKNRTRK